MPRIPLYLTYLWLYYIHFADNVALLDAPASSVVGGKRQQQKLLKG
jgi:hypothetical protein